MTTDLIRSLGDVLEAARPGYDLLDAYLEGRQPGALGFVAPELRASLGGRLKPVVVNYPRTVLGAIEERLDIIGFRPGADSPAAEDLWRVWAVNGLDLAAQQAHLEALLYGRCPVIVWAGTDPATPRVTVESARQTTVAYTPGTRNPTGALKLWAEDGYGRAVTFTPDRVTTWRSRGKVVEWAGAVPADGWTAVESTANRLGVVPVVELVNRARLIGGGESELVDVVPIVDAISKLATDMMVSAEFSAMPRRWVTGIELPENTAGEPDTASAFAATAGRTWFLEDPDTKVGQFPEATLTGFVAGIELLTQQLATVTGLPAHYLNSLTGQLPSAESLRSAEASLVARVKRKQTGFGAAWEQVARLVWLVRDGRLPPGADTLETVWADPESRTDAMAADAALKRSQLGVPWEQLMLDLGYTPAQVQAMRRMRRTAALDGQGLDLTQLANAGPSNAVAG